VNAVLEKNGCVDVHTYIPSGNVVFRTAMSDAARLAKRLAAAISTSHGFEPRVFVITRGELERVADGNPFQQADENPKSLHVFFLAELPKKPDLKSLEAIKIQNERFELKGRIFYLYTSDGFGTSKLAARAQRRRCRGDGSQLAHRYDAARNGEIVTVIRGIERDTRRCEGTAITQRLSVWSLAG
jgi:uncharacterized protein (DUF1697 family)